jgi:FkbM family methyltransferase
MSTFYSQNGEDVVLDEIFKGKKEGFFVEVGCIDGRLFSTTLTFEERGWKGLCIEAHSGYIDLLTNNRPNSVVVHCAVGEQDEDETVFWANSRGSLSTLDGTQEEHFRTAYPKYFTGFEKQAVKKRRLDTIFNEYGVKHVDILSIDIEGYEIEALRGMDFAKIRPPVLVVESEGEDHGLRMDEILLNHGYHRSLRTGSSVFYLTDKTLARRLAKKRFHATLLHTQHPLDHTGEKRVQVEVNSHRNMMIGWAGEARRRFNRIRRYFSGRKS